MKKIISSNIFLFVLFTIGYMIWRHGAPVVWNDTGLFKAAGVNAYKVKAIELGIIETILIYFNSVKVLLPDLFREVSQHGYRPVAQLLHFIFSIMAHNKSIYPSWGQLFVVGTIIGALAVSFKILVSRFIKSEFLIYLSLILFMLSSPLLSSSWILYVGVPALVPLFSAISFILYFKILDNPKNVWIYYLFLFLTLFISTWYREFIIAVPITMLALETLRTHRITKLSLLSAVLILHSLFPTFFPHLIYPQLTFKPVFQLGLVNEQLSNSYIRQEVSRHLLNIPSPSFLIVLFLIFFIYSIVDKGKNYLLLVSISLGLIGLIGVVSANDEWPYHLLLLSLFILIWKIDYRLSVWTAAFLLPFYKVFTEQIHLAYVMLPLTILFSVLIEHFLNAELFKKDRANMSPPVRSTWGSPEEIPTAFGLGMTKSAKLLKLSTNALLKTSLAIGITIAILDAFANLFAVKTVMTNISFGIENVAKDLQAKITDKPISVISNALHSDDMRLYLKGDYELFWTSNEGHDRPDRVIDTDEKLTRYVNSNFFKKNIFILEIQHDYPVPALADNNFRKLLHTTKAEYLMPDPLRHFGNRAFFSFLGPPDLENDFYRGPSSRFFYRLVKADYYLFNINRSPLSRE